MLRHEFIRLRVFASDFIVIVMSTVMPEIASTKFVDLAFYNSISQINNDFLINPASEFDTILIILTFG